MMRNVAQNSYEQIERLTHAYSQAPWRKQLQVLGLFSLVLVFAALIAGLYLSVTARATNIGRNIQYMQYQIELLKQEKADLEAQLASLYSGSVMEPRALALGFAPIESEVPIYITVSGYRGRQPAVLAPTDTKPLESAPVLPAEYTESIFTWLERQLSKWIYPTTETQP